MSYAIVFPGQGSQYVGMGLELAEKYPEAAKVFEEADEALGRSISSLIKEGPIEELTLTWNTQPAILTASIATYEALKSRVDIAPVAMAGHSLGEYSALVAAGSLDFADAVQLVEKRGRFMQAAVPVGVGTMYAILGLDAAELERICVEVAGEGEVASVANDNCKGQIVVSGHASTLEKVAARAKEAGAKRAVELSVSAPFHCSLMNPAAEQLAVELEQLVYFAPDVPVVANVDGKANESAIRIPSLLAAQVSGQVRWQDCVKEMAAMGATTFVEVGPGKVLTGLLRRIDKSLTGINVENCETLDSFVEGV